MKTPTNETITRVSQAYPSNLPVAFDLFGGDVNFRCHAHATAQAFKSDAYKYIMTVPPGSHGQDQYYYLYTGTIPNPLVTKPDAALELQEYFRRFIWEGRMGGGEWVGNRTRTHWPACGSGQRWMNISSEGFDVVMGDGGVQDKRYQLIMDRTSDPKNG